MSTHPHQLNAMTGENAMTRDEAVAKLKAVKNHGDYTFNRTMSAHGLVDGLNALGILKLDEPKTIEQRLDEAVRANLYAETPYSQTATYIRPDYLMEVIARAGLRIVEK